MSFNRLSYDDCSYKKELSQNISYLSYNLDPIRYEHCNQCRSEIGTVGGNNVSIIKGNLVDLENNLFGIDRPNTHCPNLKWTPTNSQLISGKKDNKLVEYPQIDTTPLHLRSCQFFNTLGVPQPPPINKNKC